MRDAIAMQNYFLERLQTLPYYFIAELGLNHNGSLELAHELVEIAAHNGASAVKLQKRTVDELAIESVLSAKDERFPSLGNTYREIREHHELAFSDFVELRDHAESLGLDFFVTPFDKSAVDFLKPLELVAIKVASHSVTNIPLVSYIANQRKPTIMSTGMSTIDEIDTAVHILERAGVHLVLMHCVSSYPTEDSDLNLRVISQLLKRYNLPVGYSGHEENSIATLIAFALGARVIERHITTSKKLEGFDHRLSLEPDELNKLTSDLKHVHLIMGTDVKRLLASEMKARNNYNVSMVSSRDILQYETFSEDMIVWKNPGIGIPPKDVNLYLGKPVTRSIKADSLITPEDFQ